MNPNKIISGGQTGADQGGLLAGRDLGIPTGGTAPPNFMTENGTNDGLKDFGLVEGAPDARIWPRRTWKNVHDSDGTVLFGNTGSPGSRLTIRYCKTCPRPYICNPTPGELYSWVVGHNIEVLNVAGNRESTNPGICEKVRNTLVEAFRSDKVWE